MGKIYQKHKIYQMDKNIYGHKIYQMAVKYANIFSLKGPPKYIQMGIFGMQMYHVAILVW
jgi:hypothetical protein